MSDLVLGYCPIGNAGHISPFDDVFQSAVNVINGLSGVDCVVFWGGTDISPSFYSQDHHPANQATQQLSARDRFEKDVMEDCISLGIPMIGVCRGAQLMCAIAGGKLIQHVTNHHGSHNMLTSDGRSISTTSCHHQMMYPFDVEHEMLAWSEHSRSSCYEGENPTDIVDMSGKVEPEVVYFPTIKGLAIQGHPEWANPTSDFCQYVNSLTKEKLFNTVLEK